MVNTVITANAMMDACFFRFIFLLICIFLFRGPTQPSKATCDSVCERQRPFHHSCAASGKIVSPNSNYFLSDGLFGERQSLNRLTARARSMARRESCLPLNVNSIWPGRIFTHGCTSGEDSSGANRLTEVSVMNSAKRLRPISLPFATPRPAPAKQLPRPGRSGRRCRWRCVRRPEKTPRK
jgi:hypothetical protein